MSALQAGALSGAAGRSGGAKPRPHRRHASRALVDAPAGAAHHRQDVALQEQPPVGLVQEGPGAAARREWSGTGMGVGGSCGTAALQRGIQS